MRVQSTHQQCLHHTGMLQRECRLAHITAKGTDSSEWKCLRSTRCHAATATWQLLAWKSVGTPIMSPNPSMHTLPCMLSLPCSHARTMRLYMGASSTTERVLPADSPPLLPLLPPAPLIIMDPLRMLAPPPPAGRQPCKAGCTRASSMQQRPECVLGCSRWMPCAHIGHYWHAIQTQL